MITVCSIGLGIGLASSYPSLVSWLAKQTDASATLSSLLVIGQNTGSLVLPMITGVCMQFLGADSLLYICLINALLLAILFVFANVVVKRYIKQK